MDTNPENFRRDREWYCPTCLSPCHSVEQMQICEASHHEEFTFEPTPQPEHKWAGLRAVYAGIADEANWAEKRQAWEKTLKERRHVFALVPVGEGR